MINHPANEKYALFLQAVYTTTDAAQVQEVLDQTLNNLYRIHHQELLPALLDKLPSSLSLQLRAIFTSPNLKPANLDTLKTVCEELQQSLHQCPLLSLTLAFNPSFHLAEKLGQLIKQEFGINVILELNVDPSIIAGSVITFKGKYLDNSLHNKIKQYLQSEKL